MSELRKGDLPGHEFRGNQYTGGGGLNEKGKPEKGGRYEANPLGPLKGRDIRQAVSGMYSNVVEAYGTVQQLDARVLRSRQPTVNVDRVKQFVDNPKTAPKPNAIGEESTMLLVAHRAGQYAVIDGNHRAVAAALRGDKVTARVVDMDTAYADAKARHERDPLRGLDGHLMQAADDRLKSRGPKGRALRKEYVAPTSPTSGLQPYGTGGKGRRRLTWEQRLRAKLRRNGRQEFLRPTAPPTSFVRHLKETLGKGDLPGHPFRGNQWTTDAEGLLSTERVFGNPVEAFPKYEDTKPTNVGVPLTSLVPTQDTMDPKAVKEYAKGRGDFAGLSIEVVRRGDKYLITDGHHRAAAAIANAKKTGRYYLVASKVGELPATLGKRALSVDHAAHEAAASPFNLRREPTEGQKSSGQYKKGAFKIGGLDVRVENPAGSRRRPEWPELRSHYGYFAGTRGADGDPVDCFVRVGTPLDYDGPAFVINQVDERGGFDEHKVMLGWHDWDSARAAYLENFTPGWRVGAEARLSLAELRSWLRDGDTRRPFGGQKLKKILLDRLSLPAFNLPRSYK